MQFITYGLAIATGSPYVTLGQCGYRTHCDCFHIQLYRIMQGCLHTEAYSDIPTIF